MPRSTHPYIRLDQGFAYLTALIDIVSRKVMGWHLSPYLETEGCLKALEMALSLHDKPKIINSDQGCQFTSAAWIIQLIQQNISISMNGKGRCLDNVYIERFWRTIKYEEVYLKSYETMTQARHAIAQYISWYNTRRPHQALQYKTPHEVYQQSMSKENNHVQISCKRQVFMPLYSLQNLDQSLLKNDHLLV